MKQSTKNVLASYGRSLLATAGALWLAGFTDWRTLSYALIAAILPPFLRALDPNDPAFGKLPKVEDFDSALATVKKPVKKTVKKTTAKKTAAKKTAKKTAKKKTK